MRNSINLSCPPVVHFAIYSFLLLLVVATTCCAQETIIASKEANSTQPVIADPYTYTVEGRTDPFKPFISKKATTPAGRDPNEVIDEKAELTGMQLFEPGQLTLVGVLMTGTGELALVEDQTKKGYMLKRGTLIGRRGVVTLIDKQQVVITETAHTRAGKEISSTFIMRLKKEGDK
jgi:type IV pilus assembly protein PilP